MSAACTSGYTYAVFLHFNIFQLDLRYIYIYTLGLCLGRPALKQAGRLVIGPTVLNRSVTYTPVLDTIRVTLKLKEGSIQKLQTDVGALTICMSVYNIHVHAYTSATVIAVYICWQYMQRFSYRNTHYRDSFV